MPVAYHRSLSVRLAGLIGILSGIALFLVAELNRRAVERILGEQAEVQAMLATNAVADGLDALVGSVERVTRLVARDLESRPVDAAGAERLARDILLDHPQLHGFGIALQPPGAARVGVAVRRAQTATRFIALDLTAPERAFWERDWFMELRERAAPSWGEPYFDREADPRQVVRLAVPIWRREGDDREFAGAVEAVVDLGWLRRLANANEFSDTGFTLVFSRSGRLVVHPKETFVIAETMDTLAEKTNAPALSEMRQLVLARKQGSVRYVEAITGRRVHANYKPARGAGWGVIVGYDEAEFLRPQREFRRVAAVYLGATLIILGGIVVFVTRGALRPLGGLARAADEIARENLDCEVPEPRRDDEVGRLAAAFRAMRDALKAQHLERRWAAQALEHQLKYNQLVIDSIGELVFVLTTSLNITRINPAVTRVGGYDAREIIRTPFGHVVSLRESEDAPGFAEAVRTGSALHDRDAELRVKQGGVIRVRLSLVPLTDEGRVVGAVATLRVDEPRD